MLHEHILLIVWKFLESILMFVDIESLYIYLSIFSKYLLFMP